MRKASSLKLELNYYYRLDFRRPASGLMEGYFIDTTAVSEN